MNNLVIDNIKSIIIVQSWVRGYLARIKSK